MDNEMIERAACGLFNCSKEEWLTKSYNFRKVASKDIINMIKAMREPTEKMLEAALHDYMYREKNKMPWNGKVMYNRMIDAIIND